jgi:hypothetical protein
MLVTETGLQPGSIAPTWTATGLGGCLLYLRYLIKDCGQVVQDRSSICGCLESRSTLRNSTQRQPSTEGRFEGCISVTATAKNRPGPQDNQAKPRINRRTVQSNNSRCTAQSVQRVRLVEVLSEGSVNGSRPARQITSQEDGTTAGKKQVPAPLTRPTI